MTWLPTCPSPVHRRGLGTTSPSARSHLSVAQINLQHPLNMVHLGGQIPNATGLGILEKTSALEEAPTHGTYVLIPSSAGLMTSPPHQLTNVTVDGPEVPVHSTESTI